MRRARSILFLFLCGLSAAGLLPAVTGTTAPAMPARIKGSVIADLDGDRQADVATSRATRRGGSSYLHDITFHFSGSEDRVITVRTILKAERMTLRDLDGDADCDLVLESITREPLAVLLNDGNGQFHEGDLDEFRSQLEHRSSHSAAPTQKVAPSDELGESPDAPAAIAVWTSRPELSCVRFALRGSTAHCRASISEVSSRGPPTSF
jgi:hypothetical protein